jgi:hypothetical protein
LKNSRRPRRDRFSSLGRRSARGDAKHRDVSSNARSGEMRPVPEGCGHRDFFNSLLASADVAAVKHSRHNAPSRHFLRLSVQPKAR